MSLVDKIKIGLGNYFLGMQEYRLIESQERWIREYHTSEQKEAKESLESVLEQYKLLKRDQRATYNLYNGGSIISLGLSALSPFFLGGVVISETFRVNSLIKFKKMHQKGLEDTKERALSLERERNEGDEWKEAYYTE